MGSRLVNIPILGRRPVAASREGCPAPQLPRGAFGAPGGWGRRSDWCAAVGRLLLQKIIIAAFDYA